MTLRLAGPRPPQPKAEGVQSERRSWPLFDPSLRGGAVRRAGGDLTPPPPHPWAPWKDPPGQACLLIPFLQPPARPLPATPSYTVFHPLPPSPGLRCPQSPALPSQARGRLCPAHRPQWLSSPPCAGASKPRPQQEDLHPGPQGQQVPTQPSLRVRKPSIDRA